MTVAAQRTRRRQLREETRRQILDTAQEFLRERSFRELSVDALMTRTGHTRTVFYRHFDDIPSLVLALIEEIGAEVVTFGEEWADTPRTGPDVARARLAVLVDFHVRFGPLVRAVSEASHHDETIEQAYSAMIDGFIAMTTRAIEERITSGDLEPIDAPEIARALIRMLGGYLEDTLGRHPQLDPERVLDVITTIWTRTLFPHAT